MLADGGGAAVSRQTELFGDGGRGHVWPSVSTGNHRVSACRLRLWYVCRRCLKSKFHYTNFPETCRGLVADFPETRQRTQDVEFVRFPETSPKQVRDFSTFETQPRHLVFETEPSQDIGKLVLEEPRAEDYITH